MKVAIRILALFLGLQIFAFATESNFPNLPNHLNCLDQNQEVLGVQNQQVLEWKRTTPDQTLKRALIQGVVIQMYSNKTGHTHFAISIDGDSYGDIEVIYNDEFGMLPSIRPGMQVIACGDYITVGPKARLPSPMGAIIHWLHYNPGDRDGGRHKHGFLVIDGKTYGMPSLM